MPEAVDIKSCRVSENVLATSTPPLFADVGELNGLTTTPRAHISVVAITELFEVVL